MIDVKTLEMFYWTCQLNSFSRAAEKMSTTQSSVSQRISSLEDKLGFKLLIRDSRNISITAEGRRLLEYAEDFIRLNDEMMNDLGMNKNRSISIRLGVSDTIVNTWLTDFIEGIQQKHPNIMLEITVDKTSVMYSSLLTRDLDLCFMLGPANDPKLISDPLNSYPLIFCGKPNIVDRVSSQPHGLGKTPIITYPVTAYPFSVLKDRFIQSGVKNPRIFTISALSTLIKLALDGMGIALLPEAVAKPLLQSGQLRSIDLDVRVDPLHFYSIYMRAVDDHILRDLAKVARTIDCNH